MIWIWTSDFLLSGSINQIQMSFNMTEFGHPEKIDGDSVDVLPINIWRKGFFVNEWLFFFLFDIFDD